MPNQSVPSNAMIPVEVLPLLLASDGVTPATGKTNIKARLRRLDGDVYDWSDDTFKSIGSVSQLLKELTEVDSTNFAGEYKLLFNLLDVVNPNIGSDVFSFTVIEDGGDDIANLPQSGQLRIEVALDDSIRSRKLLDNNQDLFEGSLENLITYDDDNVTILAKHNIKDKNALGISLGSGVPAIREKVAIP